jgi:hypothetical protein
LEQIVSAVVAQEEMDAMSTTTTTTTTTTVPIQQQSNNNVTDEEEEEAVQTAVTTRSADSQHSETTSGASSGGGDKQSCTQAPQITTDDTIATAEPQPMPSPIIRAQQTLLASFKISQPLQRAINMALCQAMLSQTVIATVHDFVLLSTQCHDVIEPACVRDYYSAPRDAPPAEIITEDTLSLSLMQAQQLQYYQKEIAPRCIYLRERHIHYFLCRRPIELLWSPRPAIFSTEISWWQRLKWGTQQGFYYAIVINFSMSQRTVIS